MLSLEAVVPKFLLRKCNKTGREGTRGGGQCLDNEPEEVFGLTSTRNETKGNSFWVVAARNAALIYDMEGPTAIR